MLSAIALHPLFDNNDGWTIMNPIETSIKKRFNQWRSIKGLEYSN